MQKYVPNAATTAHSMGDQPAFTVAGVDDLELIEAFLFDDASLTGAGERVTASSA